LKLPWITVREDEAQLWAERYFASLQSASRVASLLSHAVDCSINELEPHRLLASYASFTELAKV